MPPGAAQQKDARLTSLPTLTLEARSPDRASDRIYTLLVAAIRELRLLPATVLSENALASTLGVSRTPIREALARLADARLVEVTPQVGTRVVRISMAEARQAQWIRECLETRAVELVCAGAEHDLQPLKAAIRVQAAAHRAKDLDGFFRADEQFHAEIFRLAGYPGAWDVLVRSKIHLDRLRRLSVPSSAAVGALVIEHRKLMAALAARDAAAGVALLRTHARRVLELQPALQRSYPDYFVEESHGETV